MVPIWFWYLPSARSPAVGTNGCAVISPSYVLVLLVSRHGRPSLLRKTPLSATSFHLWLASPSQTQPSTSPLSNCRWTWPLGAHVATYQTQVVDLALACLGDFTLIAAGWQKCCENVLLEYSLSLSDLALEELPWLEKPVSKDALQISIRRA